MSTVTACEAKTHLPRLLRAVERIVITRATAIRSPSWCRSGPARATIFGS